MNSATASRGGGPAHKPQGFAALTKLRLIKGWVSFAFQTFLGEKTLLKIERNWLSL